MNRLLFKRLVFIASATAAVTAYAGWSLTGDPSVSFSAVGTVGLKFEGKASKLSVKDDGTNTTLTVAIKDLDTNIGLRNKHMAQDLEAEKYPDISLTIADASLAVLQDGKALEGEGKGLLTLHGKSKDITFKYKASCKGGSCEVEAQGNLNVKDFDVKVRSYLGVTVKPDVGFRAKFVMTK